MILAQCQPGHAKDNSALKAGGNRPADTQFARSVAKANWRLDVSWRQWLLDKHLDSCGSLHSLLPFSSQVVIKQLAAVFALASGG